MNRGLLACASTVLTMLAGCAGSGASSADPLDALQNRRLDDFGRVQAIDRAWVQSQGSRRAEVIEALRRVAWTPDEPAPVRIGALRQLLEDPAQAEEVRSTARSSLPREPSLEVVDFLGGIAAERVWADLAPALIRSYARPAGIPDSQRPEWRALETLNPGRSVEEAVFNAFASATDDAPGSSLRAAAWNLLARLDPDGSTRVHLIASLPAADKPEDPLISDLRAGLSDFHIVPITSEEIEWLRSLRRSSGPWWTETASVVAGLSPEQAAGLRLGHLASLRWAAARRKDWLALDTASLRAELASRLRGRRIHQREARQDVSKRPSTERLPEIEPLLAWGDLVSILALDDAIHEPALVAAFFTQAEQDRSDRTTEYGGLLFHDGPRLLLYPPRPTERFSDIQFVASPDMLAQGDLAAAHYHFHAATLLNGVFSGPSEGDLEYADRYGRMCLVLTSTAAGVLAVDVYRAGGVILDLGELRADR